MTVARVSRLFLTVPGPVFGASLIVFVLGLMAPGDPAREALAPPDGGTPDPAAVAALRADWGLEDPLPVRYVSWLGHVLTGDLGVSYSQHRAVSDLIGERVGQTISLAVLALVAAAIVGVPLGVYCAFHQRSPVDRCATAGSAFVTAVPSFVIALVLIALFAERLGWLPTSGSGTARHMILPVIALGLGEGARISRLVRAYLSEVLRQDFIRTAHGKGLATRAVAWGHALPHACPMLATQIGLHLGSTLGGAAIIEVVFARPGLGSLAIDATTARDVPVIQGCVLVTAIAWVVVTAFSSGLASVLSPIGLGPGR